MKYLGLGAFVLDNIMSMGQEDKGKSKVEINGFIEHADKCNV
ncbi:MAG: hypothetical protein Q8862_00975 [Bacteroidota bacterium]|nr:hypothetical protein [Bacteroidota bacterium]